MTPRQFLALGVVVGCLFILWGLRDDITQETSPSALWAFVRLVVVKFPIAVIGLFGLAYLLSPEAAAPILHRFLHG